MDRIVRAIFPAYLESDDDGITKSAEDYTLSSIQELEEAVLSEKEGARPNGISAEVYILVPQHAWTIA